MSGKGHMNQQRSSNIELLRILAMCGVIILHYNNPLLGGAFLYAEGVNLLILYLLESLSICAVNLFVLISGYFMCTNNKRTLLKPLGLIIQVVVFNEALYLLRVMTGRETISVRHLLGNMVPANWFVILYAALYFISPFLNMCIEKVIEKRIFNKLIIILVLLFSVYPTAVDVLGEITGNEYTGLSTVGMYGSQWGYTIVNFSLMYIIGAWLRCQENTENKYSRRFIIRLIVLVSALTIWAFINDMVGYGTGRSAWEYCNPLVVLAAVEIFKIFRQVNIGCIPVVNEMAKGSFTVFLLHNVFLRFIGIEKYVEGSSLVMLLHVLVSAVVIYLICWCVYEIYECVTRPIYNVLLKNFQYLKWIFWERMIDMQSTQLMISDKRAIKGAW